MSRTEGPRACRRRRTSSSPAVLVAAGEAEEEEDDEGLGGANWYDRYFAYV
ncbi:hypothetical protein [Streptomyces sp. NPDC060184]|uniref:hypothetical protein n=1 Tax=Streptomyces sp. NPDC060184 TaxID=3347064 RepID=UPI00364F571E